MPRERDDAVLLAKGSPMVHIDEQTLQSAINYIDILLLYNKSIQCYSTPYCREHTLKDYDDE